jgi:hypothetical protein
MATVPTVTPVKRGTVSTPPPSGEDTMSTTATYRPDPLIVAGCAWARRQGIANQNFSVLRVGDHAHVINCMFDTNSLAAVVTTGGPGYAAHVEHGSSCKECAPITYSVNYRWSDSKRIGGNGDLTWEQLRQTARNLNRLGDRFCDIEARDSRGRDVTFEVPEFLIDVPAGGVR